MDLLLFGPGLLSVLGASSSHRVHLSCVHNKHPFSGETHRKQRKMLNPVFSVNHMRHMLPLFYEVTDRVRLRDLYSVFA